MRQFEAFVKMILSIIKPEKKKKDKKQYRKQTKKQLSVLKVKP